MRYNVFLMSNDDYNQTIETCACEILEYMKKNHPESRFASLDKVDKCVGYFGDFIVGLIIDKSYIDNDNIKMGDIISLNVLKSDDELCNYVLDILGDNSDYHLVFINKVFYKQAQTINLYPRHHDSLFLGIDIFSLI